MENGGTARNVHARIALGTSAAGRGHRSRTGVVAVENRGATFHLVASVRRSDLLRRRCPTWTSSFDRMSTALIPSRAKSK